MDKTKFQDELETLDWTSELDISKNNADFSTETFIKIINKKVKESVPLSKIKKNDRNVKRKPWITNGILKSIIKKNKLYKKILLCKKNRKKKLKLTE